MVHDTNQDPTMKAQVVKDCSSSSSGEDSESGSPPPPHKPQCQPHEPNGQDGERLSNAVMATDDEQLLASLTSS